MHKKLYETIVNDSTITTDTTGLMKMLNCGRVTAVQIGMEAEAKVQVGKRVLWNLSKIQKYIDVISL